MVREFKKPTPEEIESRRKMYDEVEKLGIDLCRRIHGSIFCYGDEENGLQVCLQDHLTTANHR